MRTKKTTVATFALLAAFSYICNADANKPGEYLLHGFESTKGTLAYSWKLSSIERRIVPGRVGNAMKVVGTSMITGGKADIPVINKLPEGLSKLKVWIYAPEKNEERPAYFAWSGFDAEGESLIVKLPINWKGWKQLELDIPSAPWKSTYRQKDKNGNIDLPLKSLHLNWFSSAPTTQNLIFDQLTASPAKDAKINWSGFPVDNFDIPEKLTPGESMEPVVTFNNPSNKELSVSLAYTLFPSSNSKIPLAPHPLYGADIALGRPSKTIVDDKVVAENTITDGNPNTKAWIMAKKDQNLTDAYQIIDFKRMITPKWISIRNSDANWVYLVDVESSTNGKDFTPIADLRNIKLFHKWGEGLFLSTKAAPSSRYLRFHYHTKGLGSGTYGPGKVVDGGGTKHYKLPCVVKVYDGLNDENTELPRNSLAFLREKVTIKVPAKSFASTKLKIPQKSINSLGCYILGGRTIIDNEFKGLVYRRFFVWRPAPLKPVPGASHYGVNASSMKNAKVIRAIGFKNVRFENMKWYMCSTKRGEAKFNGSIAPWRVNQDAIIANYNKLGIKAFPMILGCPKWASSQPTKKRCFFYPPSNPKEYGDFIFQVVARYGGRKVPASELITSDKKSGFGWINCFEIWNEPDLNHPRWGALVGQFKDFFPILRAGYEGAKKADPDCKVLNGGLAGLQFKHWEEMRKFKYPDGKHPLDFIDIMNVHFYSGKNPPEIPSVNTNVNRGNGGEVEPTFQEQLAQLASWRDKHKKGAPIWLTENGWDTIGGHFVTETQQAAYLVRSMVLARDAGIDRIYVYREKDSGSTLYASCGFTRKDGSFKPSAFSFSYLIQRTDAAKCLGRVPHKSKDVYAYLFRGEDQKSFLVAWKQNMIATAAKTENVLSLPSPPTAIHDSFGQNLKKTAKIKLSMFPLYIDIPNGTAAKLAEAVQASKIKAMAKRKMEERKKAFLFDFGNDSHVAIKFIGNVRVFTNVNEKTLWDNGKNGYGFEEGAISSEDRKWVKNDLFRDAVRCGKKTKFKLTLPKGEYKLEFGFEPFGGEKAVVEIYLDEKLITTQNIKPAKRLFKIKTSVMSPSDDSVLTVKTTGTYSMWRALTVEEK